MSRWINAEWLEENAKQYSLGYYDYDEWATPLNVLDSAPSIDIVRCGECKYWKESQYYPEVMVCTYVKGATFTRQHDDFCSRGERKESE